MGQKLAKNRTLSIKRYFAFGVAVWIILNGFVVYWDVSNQLGTDPQHLFRMLLGVGVICSLGLIALGWAGARILGHVSETERLNSLITEEKNNALLSKIRFESIFNSIADGIVFTDLDRKIIMINQGFVDLLGYSLQDVKGKDTSFLYVNPAEYDAIGEAHYINDNDVGTTPVEIELKKRDGSAFMAELQGTKVLGLDGRKLGYVWIIRDITERYITMKELALNRKRLEVMLLLNEMSEATEPEIIHFGLEQAVQLTESKVGYFQFISDDQKNMDFFTWSDGVFKNFVVQSDDKYQLEEKGVWGDCMRTGEPVVHNNYKSESDQTSFPGGLSQITKHMCVPLLDKGKVIAIVGVGNKEEPYSDFDIGQIRILSQNMLRLLVRQQEVKEHEELQFRLQQANKMEAIGTLAGGIAHDFNNILGIIHGNADMAMEDVPADDPVQKNIFRILQAAKRAKEIIRQILLFSRQGELKLSLVQPRVLVEETLDLLRSTLPATVRIEQYLSDDKSPVNVDSTQFQQLLMNLFVNAVDAMDEKGTITVTSQFIECQQLDKGHVKALILGDYFQLKVMDTGAGMDKAMQGRIFDPFFTTKKASEGTGMGLSTVKGIVENHGGEIFVESEPGQGTTFYVYFPLAKDVDNVAETIQQHHVMHGNERILFVDDEEMIAEMGTVMLNRLGYEVTAVSSSTEALELFQSNPAAFDLVITDQAMPDLSGYELSTELLKIRPELPIILCTGFSKKVNRKKALELGIREFVYKPLDRQKFSSAIRKVLGDSTSAAS